MRILVLKLGASGDVVRTTSLLRRLQAEVVWLTSPVNLELLTARPETVRPVAWEGREALRGRRYDLVVNLEDTVEVAAYARTLDAGQKFGAYLDGSDTLCYTDDSRGWFDMSLISRYGKERADALKLRNRRTYQELVFEGLGFTFADENYVLPKPPETDLAGDVAIAAEAGTVWPMKNWAHYEALKRTLEHDGLVVNVLPRRSSLLAHLGDVCNHRCLVSGDSLPMHIALGTETRCVTLFTCTSPWEIYDYGIQKKLVSPLLEEFFYKRGFDPAATSAISTEAVREAVLDQLESSTPARSCSR